MKDIILSPLQARFKAIFEVMGLTQKEFGVRLGLSQNQVSTILTGKSSLSVPVLNLLKYEYGVDPNYIFKGQLPMFLEGKEHKRIQHIPIIASIPAGDWDQWIDSYPPGVGDGYLDLSDVKGRNLFAVRVKGDSMEPSLVKGDILVINPNKEFSKGLAVVRHDFNDEFAYKIRMVRKHSDSYILTPVNPRYDELSITPNQGTRLYVPIKVISMRDL